MEPNLSGIDLGPYFYFARSSLGIAQSVITQKLGPVAQNILTDLLSASDARTNHALGESKNIDDSEAAAILITLGEKISIEEDHSSEHSALSKAIKWVAVRKELFNELILLFKSLPTTDLPPKLPLDLSNNFPGQISEPIVHDLLNGWSEGTSNGPLAKASKQLLSQ